ncbi:hypothetical protein [Pelosinus sp. UFO1]|uniref:hypothetical protein n=1 Tax=Pelosinus sp. UFO1 TaxID=484770 RepID=UPI0004D1CDA0|nr:hypothetical protein [Pelosinus sp. UFO1]AIF51848.1 hypothetical protein UFO1_2301 [Pelosinus sp. UFO1]
MKGWSADFVNDPNNDFEVVLEILYEDKDVAVIRQGVDGLEIHWYENTKRLVVPVDWLVKLLIDAKEKLR